MMSRAVVGLAASVLLAAGAAAPAAAAPAAAACDDVTVVVDYNELGDDTRSACVAPGTAAEAFADAGVELEYVPQLPGFVCRVTGVPADGPCTDGDSYWSLWWTDGTSDWTYASLGVGSLDVPAGGYVGFAWHEGSGDAEPPDEVRINAGDGPDVTGSADEDTAATSGTDEEPAATSGTDADDGSFPLWAVGVVALVVLGLAVIPLLRRRRT